jgi:lactaldehyde reductase
LKSWYKSCIISIIKDITLITEIIYFERRNNQMANRMILNETSYFGAGSISEIVTEAKKRAFKKALVVTDPDLIKFNVAKNVTDLLEKAGLAYDIFSQVKANPTVKVVKAGIEAFKAAGADYLIAIGGGSSMDTAKAIGIIINNPEYADVTSLEGAIDTKNPCVPIIAVPTTAGTAAEVTINYVITDEEKKRKFVCVDPHDIPVVAVIDAKMMSSMPKGLTASTGMDALTHAIEGYTTLGAWELTDMMHLKAIEIISRSLRKAVENDPQGREDMALGQYIAGMGFSNVGLGVVHGMAHPLGAFYDTPHGIANAVLLPYVMEYNAEYTGEKFKYIAEAMGVDTTGMSQAEYRAAAVNAVKQLSKDVGIPEKLHEIGVKEEDLQALSESAFADVCTGGNPRPCTVESILGIYKTAF